MLTRLQIEKWGPTIVGLTVMAGWWLSDLKIESSFAKELLSALLSASAIAAGFLATALSILLPVASMEVGKKLRRSGYLPYLYRYLREAVYSCLALAGICIITFFEIDADKGVHKLFAIFVIFLSGYSAATLVRVAEVLMNIFEYSNQPEDKEG
jgi:hypothetical protein